MLSAVWVVGLATNAACAPHTTGSIWHQAQYIGCRARADSSSRRPSTPGHNAVADSSTCNRTAAAAAAGGHQCPVTMQWLTAQAAVEQQQQQ
jgi:hypothetical protein